MSARAPRIFVFGLGYSARAFAAELGGEAEWIGGTSRMPSAGDSTGPVVLPFDGAARDNSVAAALIDVTHLLVSIPPSQTSDGEAGDPVLLHHRADIIAAPKLEWIGYLSTVGVYGDHEGAWVDETSDCFPVNARSRRRRRVEEEWRDLAAAKDVPLGIFRIAGIYGPGRNALVNLAEGTARRIVKPGQVFNRIHVADIALALAAAARLKADGVFNLSDDEPAPPQDVVAFAAGLMGVPPPPEVPFDEAELSPMARSFYGESKRVSNAKLKQTLGLTLRYPSYREGLRALLARGEVKAVPRSPD